MNTRAVHIELELTVCGEDVRGSAVDGFGARRDFTGWLGLVSALDALLAERPAGEPISDHTGPTT